MIKRIGQKAGYLWNSARIFRSWRRGKSSLGYFPKMVSIEPTNACNFTCEFCPQSDPNHFQAFAKGRIRLDQVETILGMMRREGAWSKTMSFTQDGEPFVHREFEEMVRAANDHGFRPRFASNGSLLTASRAKALCEAGYFLISVDFSANRDFFETSRGSTGSWEKIRDNLRNLLALTKQYPLANVQITDITNWIYEDKQPRAEDRQSLMGLFDDVVYSSRQVVFDSRTFHTFNGTVPSGGIATAGDKYNLCPYPWISLRIRWNGDCVICCRDTRSDTVLGNVFEEGSLLKIWNGAAYREVRTCLREKKPGEVAACMKCDLPWAENDKRWSIAYLIKTYLKR